MSKVNPCSDWFARISAYADDELPLPERKAVEDHLSGCAGCRAALEACQQIREAFAEATAAQSVSTGFTARVMDRVQQAEARSERAARRRWWFRRDRPRPAAPAHPRLRLAEACVALALTVVLISMFLPVYSSSQERARQASCMSNLHAIYNALRIYAQDYDGYLPPAESGLEAVFPYVTSRRVFKCPQDTSDHATSYSLSSHLVGRKLDEVTESDKEILVYEGHQEQVEYRHNGVAYFCFADGHVEGQRGETQRSQGSTRSHQPSTINHQPLALAFPVGLNEAKLPDRLNARPDRRLAYTAQLQVTVSDAAEALAQAEALAVEQGGFVLNSSFEGDEGDPGGEASITCRVPTANFLPTIRALCQLGTVRSRQIVGQDRTEAYLSTHADLSRQESRKERLDAMRAQGRKTNAALQVERELQQAEAAVVQQQSRLRGLEGETELSTIEATFTEPLTAPPAPAWSLAGVWSQSWRAFRAVARVVGTLALWVLVFAPFWLPVLVLGCWLHRRRRHARLLEEWLERG
jgi:prepilin-type processing-associated H-X9-DG protein